MAKMGRPSKYDPKYCDMLIKHMSQGLSFLSFAGEIGVDEDTLFEWVKTHQDFSEAQKKAKTYNRTFWEKVAVKSAVAATPNYNSTMIIFNLKNRFRGEWTDRTEVVSENTTTVKLNAEDRDNVIQSLLKSRKTKKIG